MRVKISFKIHSSGWQPNNATIRTIDSLGHTIKIEGIHGIRYLMVMGIPNKGRIVDYQSRVSEFPVVPLVRHSDQTAQGQRKMLIGQANAHHLNIRVLCHGLVKSLVEFPVFGTADDSNKITHRGYHSYQGRIGQRLGPGFLGIIANHLVTNHALDRNACIVQ